LTGAAVLHDWHHTAIAALFRLSSAQIIAAIEYIEAHKEEVLKDYQAILARHAKGNSPEVEALFRAGRRRLRRKLRELAAQKAGASHVAVGSGR
jgi:hypothetical protein